MAFTPATPDGSHRRGPSKQSAPRVRAVHKNGTKILTIALPGDYDMLSKETLVALLRPAETLEQAVIDLSETDYLDCASLSVLITLRKRMVALHGEADVRLAGPNRNITKILKITGLDKVFTVFPTLEAALTAS